MLDVGAMLAPAVGPVAGPRGPHRLPAVRAEPLLAAPLHRA
ncbi:hypothetical protein [Streptomyces sp. JJ38]|nr:hypothetical protein [Streptomyces sp. JJ38]